MAKRNYVKGKSTEDLLNMGWDAFSVLSPTELRQVVSRLADAANKRLKRLGTTVTPATEQAKRGGGKFTTKGKDFTELKAEFVRVRAFLVNPTSTKKGYEKLKEEMKKQGVDSDKFEEDELAMFWRLYHRLEESDSSFKSLPPSEKRRIIQAELDANPGLSEEEHMRNLLNRMVSDYEQQQSKRRNIDLSDFFESP